MSLRTSSFALLAVVAVVGAAAAQSSSAAAGTWKEQAPLNLKVFGKFVTALAFSSDGKTLAVGLEDHKVQLWDLKLQKETAVLSGHRDELRAVAFAPDDKTLATASADGVIKLWEVADKKEQWSFDRHTGEVKCLLFGSEGKYLVSGGADKTARIINAGTGKEIKALEHPGPVFSLALSSAGTLLATGGYQPGGEGEKGKGLVRVWELPSGKQRHAFEDFNWSVTALRFAADSRSLTAATGGKSLAEPELKKVQLSDGKAVSAFKVRGHPAVFSADGRLFAARAVSDDKDEKYTAADGSVIQVVLLWDPATGKPGVVLGKRSIEVTALAIAADGKTIAFGSSETKGVFVCLYRLSDK